MTSPRSLVLALCGTLVIAGGCTLNPPDTHRKVAVAEFEHRFTPEELRADLHDFLITAEAVHPNPYHFTPREEVARLVGELEAQLDTPRTRVEFYPLAARLAAKLGDAHTNVQPPWEEYCHFVKSGGLVFPLEVKLRDGHMHVVRACAADSPVQPGDVLRTINGHDVPALLDTFREEHGGAHGVVDALIAARVTFLLWVHGVCAPFEVQYLRPGNDALLSARLEGMTEAALTSAGVVPAYGSNAWYRFERLPDNIGYIDFREMIDSPAFDAFLKQTFTEIRDRPIAGLIIDLRRNGGGYSSIGDALLSYLTDQSYKKHGRMELKVSRQYRDYLKARLSPVIRWLPLEWFHPIGRKYWGTPVGQAVIIQFDLEKPGENPLRYRGPVCFLIGPYTFSAALALANAVEDYDLATLIGQETGEAPNNFSEPYIFDLPRTRLLALVSAALFVRANGDAENRAGVQPDIEVQPTAEDERAGVDAVLERARTWIQAQGAP